MWYCLFYCTILHQTFHFGDETLKHVTIVMVKMKAVEQPEVKPFHLKLLSSILLWYLWLSIWLSLYPATFESGIQPWSATTNKLLSNSFLWCWLLSC